MTKTLPHFTSGKRGRPPLAPPPYPTPLTLLYHWQRQVSTVGNTASKRRRD